MQRAGGWRWVRLVVVGMYDGLAVLSPNRSHALFPEAHMGTLFYDPSHENTVKLVYEMVRDRKVLPADAGSRTLIT